MAREGGVQTCKTSPSTPSVNRVWRSVPKAADSSSGGMVDDCLATMRNSDIALCRQWKDRSRCQP